MRGTDGSGTIAKARKEVKAAARACLRPSAPAFEHCGERLASMERELAAIHSAAGRQVAGLRNDLLLLKALLESAMRFQAGWLALTSRSRDAGLSTEA